jgi:hypothetical protein
VRNTVSDYENYYLFRAYKRDNVLFSSDNYYGRVLWDFWNVTLQYQHWAFNFARFNKNDFWEKKYGKPWQEDLDGGRSGSLATYLGFYTLVAALGRPAPGKYRKNAKTGIFEFPLSDEQYTNESITIKESTGGRDFYNDYDFSGYIYFETKAGAFYDRLAAFQFLCDPSTYFMGVDYSSDIQRYLINYQTFFPKEMLNLLGGMFLDDYNYFGWKTQNKELYQPIIIGDPADIEEQKSMISINPNPDYLFPTTKYRIPALAAYYGMSLLVSDYDRSFTDIGKIFLVGSGESMDAPEGTEFVEFTDPLSLKTYRAYKNADPNVTDIGYQLIQLANEKLNEYTSTDELKKDYNLSVLQYVVGKIEILRGYNIIYD